MKIKMEIEFEAPDGATHFSCSLADSPETGWYRLAEVGGWQVWMQDRSQWTWIDHPNPRLLQEIPKSSANALMLAEEIKMRARNAANLPHDPVPRKQQLMALEAAVDSLVRFTQQPEAIIAGRVLGKGQAIVYDIELPDGTALYTAPPSLAQVLPKGWKLVQTEMSEEMVQASLATEWPALYQSGLGLDGDGPVLKAITEHRIATARKRHAAVLAASRLSMAGNNHAADPAQTEYDRGFSNGWNRCGEATLRALQTTGVIPLAAAADTKGN